MKRSTIFVVVMMLNLTTLGVLYPIFAQNTQNKGKNLIPNAVIFSEDFESYEVGSTFPTAPWINHNSSTSVWSIEADGGSKTARQSAAVTAIISAGDTAWTNYTVSSRVKMHSLGTRAGVIARFTTTSAYYSLYIRTSTGGTKTFEVNKRTSAGNNPLGNVSVPDVVIGNYYKLSLEVNGSSIKAYLDDVLKLEFTDADYPAGKIGLYNIGDTNYDDVEVSDFSSSPSQPVGLTATATLGQIALTWSAVSGAVSYNVKRATTDGGPYKTIATPTAASYIDTNIQSGTTYYYVVSAVNKNGESPDSAQASATATANLPASPSGLITAAGDQQVRIYWTAGAGATSYNVKRGLASSGEFETIATGVSTTEYHDTTVVNGTTYYYRISSVNGEGESANSSAAAATPRTGTLVKVSNQSQFQTAVNNAVAGDVIELADGNYSAFKIRRKFGTITSPIVIRSANPLGAVFNAGQFELEFTKHITVEGFRWTLAGSLKLRGTHHCRLTKNSFELNETGLSSLDWVSIGGADSRHNRVDHNDFKNKTALGNYVQLSGANGQVSQYDRIDHNYFYNLTPRAVNDKEAVRLGDSEVSQSSGFTVVEYNLFEQCDGDPEIISIKSSDNIVRYNTFRRSQGGLTARQGNRSLMYGNFFIGENAKGTGGIRAYGDDHKIFNNYFEGLTGVAATAPIAITNGDADNGHLPGANQSLHYRPQRILVANNTLVGNVSNIEIGGNYNLPPRDLVFANNLIVAASGNVVKYRNEPINFSYAGNIGYTTGSATIGIPATSAEINNVDPLLVVQNGISKLGNGSPAINSSSIAYAFIKDDIEGQQRDEQADIGADEFGVPVSPRLPLTSATAGLSAVDHMISGHISDKTGKPLPSVEVLISNISNSFGGTTSNTAISDAYGFFAVSGLLPGINYEVNAALEGYVFEPATINIPGITNDEYFTISAFEAPLVPFADVSGQVMANGTAVVKAEVTMTSPDGDVVRTLTNGFGYFKFPEVATGITYTLSVRSRGNLFSDRQIRINGPTEVTVSPDGQQ